MRPQALLLLCLVLLGLGLSIGAGAARAATPREVLVLHDGSGEYAWLGLMHARMLMNLLGHFPVTYKARRVGNYRAGDIERYQATFYIGSTYDNPLPAAFLDDVMASTKPVCWLGYNIWQLAWGHAEFPTEFGFTFNWLDSSGYDTIRYKGQAFTKDQTDPELGEVWILHPDACREVASACRSTGPGEEQCIPYIVQGRNLWYVADVPFTYISEEDRYLVFCDVLHEILGTDHPESKRAIIRIEDVSPESDPAALREIADYLHSQHVPFSVAVSPLYVDPMGSDGGAPRQVRLSSAPAVVAALKYMMRKGGRIVLHGYSHQYDAVVNPYSGVTGDDFEFYRVHLDDEGYVVYDGPVPEDSVTWARQRVSEARAELRACGLQETAWETPHYAASPWDYRAFAHLFGATIQRVMYFDLALNAPGARHSGVVDPSYLGGQFFPYVIQQDIYGQKVIPENLGNVEPEPWQHYPARLPEDIVRAASKNLAVRDGWSSAYFHPFYDIEYLKEVVEGIKALGFTFVPLSPNLE